jgi:hypothetical protein
MRLSDHVRYTAPMVGSCFTVCRLISSRVRNRFFSVGLQNACTKLHKSSAFALEDYVSLFQMLLDHGVQFATLESADLHNASRSRTHYLKHDIHHDLINTLTLAEAQAKMGVRATYFMMHESKLNRKFFGTEVTWRSLRDIRGMGHAIGLHIDGFELIEKYGDLRVGVEHTRKLFRERGLELLVANTHGNSEYQSRLNFETVNFYRELARPTSCTNPFWMAHYARYSIADLGFRLWGDSAFWTPDTGEFLVDYYVTDNSTCLRAGRTSSSKWEITGEKWDLSEELQKRLSEFVRNGSAEYLIHPQFVRSKEETSAAAQVSA